jgi:hypothetical protein
LAKDSRSKKNRIKLTDDSFKCGIFFTSRALQAYFITEILNFRIKKKRRRKWEE